MNITITSTNTADYLFIKSVGVLEGTDDLFKHSELVYQELSKYAGVQKILIDDLETRFPLNMFSYFEQVEFFSQTLPSEIRFLQIAIVLSPEFEEFGKFWETVSVNRGFRYFSFTSIEKAHHWLTTNEDVL